VNGAYAQDLIVTHEGDSLNCKITKIKKDHIYFTFSYKNEIRSTLLPISNVRFHQYNYYQTTEVPKEKVVGYSNYQHFRIALNGGFSYQIAKVAEDVPRDFKDYVKDLKSGYHIGGDITYYISEPLGFGIKYYLFKSSNSLDNVYAYDNYGNITYGKMSDDVTTSFIGPTFSVRLFNHKKTNAFLMNLSLGYMGYSDDKVLIDPYKITGSTLGFAFDVGYDIGLSKHLSLGFQISCITGTLFEYKLDDGVTSTTIKLEKDKYESLNRLDFSVGLRFGI
jgi:hypothetical protein